jgi:hypothetical protein
MEDGHFAIPLDVTTKTRHQCSVTTCKIFQLPILVNINNAFLPITLSLPP